MYMDKIIVRRPNSGEIDKIEAFFKLILEDTFKQNNISDLKELLEEELSDKRKYIQKDFETEGKERYFLLAEYNKEIIGSIGVGPSSELIRECTKNEVKDALEVGSVYVHPKYQRRGIVSLLLKELLIKLKEENIKTFCFDSGYPIAQAVWSKKMGDAKYIIKDCWGENKPHMIWELTIEDALSKLK